MRLKARTAWRWGGLKGLLCVQTVILLEGYWLVLWFLLTSGSHWWVGYFCLFLVDGGQ